MSFWFYAVMPKAPPKAPPRPTTLEEWFAQTADLSDDVAAQRIRDDTNDIDELWRLVQVAVIAYRHDWVVAQRPKRAKSGARRKARRYAPDAEPDDGQHTGQGEGLDREVYCGHERGYVAIRLMTPQDRAVRIAYLQGTIEHAKTSIKATKTYEKVCAKFGVATVGELPKEEQEKLMSIIEADIG